MPHVIIIGFEYNSLPGTKLDINLVYDWALKYKYTVNVITDIQNPKSQIVYNKIDFLTELQKSLQFLKKKSLLIPHNPSITGITVSTDPANIIGSPHTGLEDKLIIYYSGHGRADSLVLPNQDLYLFREFRDYILTDLPLEIEIFWILDCCNPTGLHLPFKLNNNSFHLTTTISGSSGGFFDGVPQHKILLITSSDVDEKSIATKDGSIFTSQLFKIIDSLNANLYNIIKNFHDVVTITPDSCIIPISSNRNLNRLMNHLSSEIRKFQPIYRQNVSIYSSYIIDPVLWLWIGNNKDFPHIVSPELQTLRLK